VQIPRTSICPHFNCSLKHNVREQMWGLKLLFRPQMKNTR
jgi:hypothetical protein